MEYLAHIDGDRAQSIKDHLQGTADLAEEFAAKFGKADWGYCCGMLHDIGKYSAEFQKKIKGNLDIRVDHSTAGAKVCEKLDGYYWLLTYCIAGHHAGIPDLGRKGLPSSLLERLDKRLCDYSAFEKEIEIPQITTAPVAMEPNFAVSVFIRMLYSCLVDADYLDTEQFMQGDMPRGTGDSLETLLTRLQARLNEWDNPTSELNKLRQQILRACVSAAANPKGIYTLTVPTGGGKTTSSLAFALHHAVEHGMKRVIYVVPYTSIIEQNADVFRGILGDENVLEHHFGVQFENDEENGNPDPKALAAENWDSPLVITTAVQFFESMYANRSSQCRKLHNLANSVIIFDEAQMLPLCHLMPCVAAIGALVEQFGATAVLCTATQPVLGDLIQRFAPSHAVSEICPEIPFYFDKFRRVTFRQVGVLEDDVLAEQLCTQDRKSVV